jgi:hypothetical protein
MKIDKTKLKTLWYTDKNGNEVEENDSSAVYQISRFPLEISTTHLKYVRSEEVNACKHQRKYIKRTFGWIKGIKGRECQKCNGTQVRKWWKPWGRKWEATGSRVAFSSSTNIGDERIILAMANSGDYTLKEAIIAYSEACERCSNVLWHKYTNGAEGYIEGSEEWKKCNTRCKWCKEETNE